MRNSPKLSVTIDSDSEIEPAPWYSDHQLSPPIRALIAPDDNWSFDQSQQQVMLRVISPVSDYIDGAGGLPALELLPNLKSKSLVRGIAK